MWEAGKKVVNATTGRTYGTEEKRVEPASLFGRRGIHDHERKAGARLPRQFRRACGFAGLRGPRDGRRQQHACERRGASGGVGGPFRRSTRSEERRVGTE